MRDRHIIRVILFGVLAIAGLIGVQTYWTVNTWNLNEQEFNEKINRVLLRVARSLAELNEAGLPPRNLIKKRSSNYFVVNVDNEIDPQMLEFFLQRELEAAALNLDFEYAVFDCSSNQMVYGDYCSFEPNRVPPTSLGNLPSHHGFTYYFGVRFPTRSAYLIEKAQLSAIMSGVMLLTIAFFAYAMIVILRQKRLSEMQKDFINNMTHEFKTPISTMGIAAEVFLAAEAIKSDQRLYRYAEVLRNQNSRLNEQIERVLQVARFERNEFELKKGFFSIHALIQEIAAGEEVLFVEKNGRLDLRLDANADWVHADRLHLSNVLHNLLDNARKYAFKAPFATISTADAQKGMVLCVSDQGIGIPAEYQQRIFEKFYRIPTGNVHNVKGFGLGLYYVKRICQAHGWKISLKSEPGNGAVFCISIPCKKQAK